MAVTGQEEAAERLAGRVRSIAPGQVIELGRIDVRAIAAYNTSKRDPAGAPFHPRDAGWVGYELRIGGERLYHSGDTVVYEGMVERLRPFNVDLAILPINGKVGNMGGRDAARLAHDIGAKLVIPCHYEMFEFNTASPDEFARECERLGQPCRVLRAGERLTRA